jgi:hypothetical protein
MVVTCISNPVKEDINIWFIKRIKELNDLAKLHHTLLGMSKTVWETEFHQPVKDTADFYEQLRTEFNLVPDCEKAPMEKLFGTIECLPREVKADIIPFLKGKAQRYPSMYALEVRMLADTLQNKVPICTYAGRPSMQWLRRKGYTKEDLVTRGNIKQVND